MESEPTPLILVEEFLKREPAFRNGQTVYAAARSTPGFPIVRCGRRGRRCFIDWDRWKTFKANGGAAFPGGWRKAAH